MTLPFITLEPGYRILLVMAAPREAEAVECGLGAPTSGGRPWTLRPVGERIDVLETGVGKANAAGAVAAALDPDRHGVVVNLGVAGAYPGAPVGLCDVVLGSSSVYADEGLATADGFLDIAAMGFAPVPAASGAGNARGVRVLGDPCLRAALLGCATREGVIATVSTCSGTQESAENIRERTGALAEAMEGAAIGFTLQQVGRLLSATEIPFAEVRVISNTTGERSGQSWDLDGALRVLGRVASLL